MKNFNHNSGQYLEIDGAKIYYEEIGNKKKPVLIILHGGFGNIEDLNSIVSYIPDKFRIIGIDSRGHGKSTLGNKKLTYKQIQFDVETIIKYLKINIASIIGFSDGGIVAFRIASNRAINIKKLITIGSSWCNKDVFQAAKIIKTITPLNAKEIFDNDFNSYQLLNPEPDFGNLTKSILSMWLDETNTGHPNESVKYISAKTLLIRGDNDFLVSLESLAELKGKIKDSSLLNVPFAEHLVYEEQPQIIEFVIKQFLEK